MVDGSRLSASMSGEYGRTPYSRNLLRIDGDAAVSGWYGSASRLGPNTEELGVSGSTRWRGLRRVVANAGVIGA